MTTTTDAPATTSTRTNFLAALREVRKAGVIVKQNVGGCCRSCISADSEKKLGVADGDETTPLVWTYGGQGGAYTWEDDLLVDYADLVRTRRQYMSRPAKRVESIFFNHANGGAKVLADTLRARGFDVEWDETDAMCVVVKFA